MDCFLVHQGKLYRPDLNQVHEFASPIHVLIVGVWNLFPEQALSILRERIYSNYPLTPQCQGIIKVCAKRATELDAEAYQTQLAFNKKDKPEITVQISNDLHEEVAPSSFESIEQAATFLKEAAKKSIAALLLTPELQVLSFALNTAGQNRTEHAEMNLLKNYFDQAQRKVPENSIFMISLKPCAMCAAQIFTLSESFQRLKIIYLEDDPGPKASNSVLIEKSDLWKRAGYPRIPTLEIFTSSQLK